MKYFYPELKSGIDLYADSQREDGMIWDNYNRRPEEGSYWQQRFDYADFIKVVDDGENEFHRIPVENDVEYLFIEGIYYTWKATGDDSWMKKMLDKALKAIEYSTTNPYRWSEKYQLLKRGYTIDTWDFQNDEDAAVSAGKDNFPDAMVIRLPHTRFGVMFGDNTGMYAGCLYLADMLTYAGRKEEAERSKNLEKGSKTGLILSHGMAGFTDIIYQKMSLLKEIWAWTKPNRFRFPMPIPLTARSATKNPYPLSKHTSRSDQKCRSLHPVNGIQSIRPLIKDTETIMQNGHT